MPKLHLAAPGAACTHSLALSFSYCIWSRLYALLAQLVHHSSRHDYGVADINIGTVWGNRPARRRFLPHTSH